MTEAQARDRAEIEAELAAARARLAQSVEGLIGQVHPKAIVANTVADARDFAQGSFEQAKAQMVDSRGNVRIDRVALIAAAVGGLMIFIRVVRSLRKGR